MTRTALLAGAAFFCFASGCSRIKVTTRNDDVLVRAWKEAEVDSTPHLAASVQLRNGADGEPRLMVAVTRSKSCSETEVRLVNRTEITERTRGPVWPWILHAVGVTGLGVLGGGVAGLATGTPFAAPNQYVVPGTGQVMEGDVRISWAGALFLAGLAVSSAMGFAIADDIRALDTTRHLGEVTERNVIHDGVLCELEPAAGVEVALLPKGTASILRGVTQPDGSLVIELTDFREKQEPFAEFYEIDVGGVSAGMTNVLAPLHTQWRARQDLEQAQALLSEGTGADPARAQELLQEAESLDATVEPERRRELTKQAGSLVAKQNVELAAGLLTAKPDGDALARARELLREAESLDASVEPKRRQELVKRADELTARRDAAVRREAERVAAAEERHSPGGLEAACKKGNQNACVDFGVAIADDDPARAVVLFQKACKSGQSAVACDNLGLMVAAGRGAPANDVRAASLFSNACDKRYGVGCLHLADMYFDGFGVEQSWRKTLLLAEKACGLDEPYGCERAANFYRQVTSVGIDPVRADKFEAHAEALKARFPVRARVTGVGGPPLTIDRREQH